MNEYQLWYNGFGDGHYYFNLCIPKNSCNIFPDSQLLLEFTADSFEQAQIIKNAYIDRYFY